MNEETDGKGKTKTRWCFQGKGVALWTIRDICLMSVVPEITEASVESREVAVEVHKSARNKLATRTLALRLLWVHLRVKPIMPDVARQLPKATRGGGQLAPTRVQQRLAIFERSLPCLTLDRFLFLRRALPQFQFEWCNPFDPEHLDVKRGIETSKSARHHCRIARVYRLCESC